MRQTSSVNISGEHEQHRSELAISMQNLIFDVQFGVNRDDWDDWDD